PREDQPGDVRLVAYVVPKTEAQTSNETIGENTERWQAIWDQTYKETLPAQAGASRSAEPDFNVIGWNSSYTGEPIPEQEMREWVDRTVERILDLKPRRVLEIGCGTGLLLFRVAPHCEEYVGVDFSATALDQIARNLAPRGLKNVTLSQQAAHDLSQVEPGSFDAVVVNSV